MITARLNSFKDVELLICAVQALRNIRPNCQISLYTPYFLGSRSDRKFQEGGVNYLKQVICPIINSLNFYSVVVLDPHSDVLEACLNNYEKADNHILVKWALTDIDN
jgi:phosphoribosylpyrophosphate synthetase